MFFTLNFGDKANRWHADRFQPLTEPRVPYLVQHKRRDAIARAEE